FKGVDAAASDQMIEISAVRVAPHRALADHAFAHALLARAGVVVSLSAGPLVVAPDLARGGPSDVAPRGGRALALHAASVALPRGARGCAGCGGANRRGEGGRGGEAPRGRVAALGNRRAAAGRACRRR